MTISFLFVCLFRFVPYIGIVTILMNDYPKFKVRSCPTCFVKNVIFCFIWESTDYSYKTEN